MNSNELLLNDKIKGWNSEEEELFINKFKEYCDNYKVYCETLDSELKMIGDSIDITEIDVLNGVNAMNKLSLNKYTTFTIDNNEKKEESNCLENSVVKKNEVSLTLSKENRELNKKLKYQTVIDLTKSIIPNNKSIDKNNIKIKLPYIIGTKEFFNSETLGVVQENKEEIIIDKDLNKITKIDIKNKTDIILKDNNTNKSERQLSERTKIKNNTLFAQKSDEEQEDIDDVWLKQYELAPRKSSISKAKPQVSIENFIKSDLFDLDDDSNESEKDNTLFKPSKLNQDQSLILIKEEDKDKCNLIKDNASIIKLKETPLECAQKKLLKLFDEDEEEESHSNNIDEIAKKTNEIASKLKLITGENKKLIPDTINKNRQEPTTVTNKSLFIIDDDIDNVKIEPMLIKQQTNNNAILSESKGQNHNKINKLNLIFKEDDEREEEMMNKQSNSNSFKNKTQDLLAEIQPQVNNNVSTYAKTKAMLNDKFLFIPPSQVKDIHEQVQTQNIKNEELSSNNTINILNNKMTIIAKKKPSKPLFKLNNNTNPIDTKTESIPPRTNKSILTNTESKNKIVINHKPLIKLNFAFDDDDD